MTDCRNKFHNTFPLPQPVRIALERLNAHGYEAYCVGGCVRDYLMGFSPHDFDITTSAMPEETVGCFCDFRVIETGLKHGTVTVIIDGEQLEITTFRTDGTYSDNRHPDNVTFTRSLSDDLSRRDFTVNAMAYSTKTGLCDMFLGREHLAQKVICCVGDARTRFGEDALRILRALRFSSVLGFSIAKETSDAVFEKAELLRNISGERIFSELSKLICGEDAEKIIKDYRTVFEIIFPALCEYSDSIYSLAAKSISMCEKNTVLRYAAWFYNMKPDTASGLLRSLNCDKYTSTTVKSLITFKNQPDALSDTDITGIKKFISSHSYDFARLLLNLCYSISLSEGNENKAEKIKKIIDITYALEKQDTCLFIKDLAVGGDDLMRIGVSQGAQVGKVLAYLLESVIEGKVRNTKEDLIKYLSL
ncbi:MAG: CCA tRNA nucleotidyltransferase [Clostridia bacterium]|nr:CCA tRNA nucleotidyltransferase [Clostridia bacterium]